METMLLHGVSRLQAPTSVVTINHISASDVRVFLTSLEVSEEKLRELRPILNGNEAARAARFSFPHLQHDYVVCRATLRQLVGLMLYADPRAVPIEYNAFGKPFVNMKGKSGALEFNLSHSGHYALYAFAWNRKIGVDLEQIEPQKVDASMDRRFFTATEIETLESLSPAERAEAFYACWTRKEAYIKALGQGLKIPLDSFEVSVKPDQAAAITRHFRQPSECQRWQMVDLSNELPVSGFKAALVVERTP